MSIQEVFLNACKNSDHNLVRELLEKAKNQSWIAKLISRIRNDVLEPEANNNEALCEAISQLNRSVINSVFVIHTLLEVPSVKANMNHPKVQLAVNKAFCDAIKMDNLASMRALYLIFPIVKDNIENVNFILALCNAVTTENGAYTLLRFLEIAKDAKYKNGDLLKVFYAILIHHSNRSCNPTLYSQILNKLLDFDCIILNIHAHENMAFVLACRHSNFQSVQALLKIPSVKANLTANILNDLIYCAKKNKLRAGIHPRKNVIKLLEQCLFDLKNSPIKTPAPVIFSLDNNKKNTNQLIPYEKVILVNTPTFRAQ